MILLESIFVSTFRICEGRRVEDMSDTDEEDEEIFSHEDIVVYIPDHVFIFAAKR
jgi:hypothetical protein